MTEQIVNHMLLTLKSRFFFKKIYLLIMLLQLSHSPPFSPLHPAHSLPPTFPPDSSCPWVVHIRSLKSRFLTKILIFTLVIEGRGGAGEKAAGESCR